MPKQKIPLKINGGWFYSPTKVGRYAKADVRNMRPIIPTGSSLGDGGVEPCVADLPFHQGQQPYYTGNGAFEFTRGWTYDAVGNNYVVTIGTTLWYRNELGNWSKNNASEGNVVSSIYAQTVSMANNGIVTAIVGNGGWGHYSSSAIPFENINQYVYGFPFNVFGDAIDVVCHEGYFVFINAENTIYHGGLPDVDDGKSVLPTDFGSSDIGLGGPNTALASLSNYLAVMTRYSTQFFDNVGSSNFAFSRVASIGIGCAHKSWRCVSGDVIYFVGSGPSYPLGVYAIDQSGAVKKLSNEAIEGYLKFDASGPSDYYGTMFTYSHEGRSYLVLNIFRSILGSSTQTTFGSGYTFEYDFASGTWTRRSDPSTLLTDGARWFPLHAFPENTTNQYEPLGNYVFMGRDPTSIGTSPPTGQIHCTYPQGVMSDYVTYATYSSQECIATTNWLDGGGNSFNVNKVIIHTDMPVGASYAPFIALDYSIDGTSWNRVDSWAAAREYREFHGIGYFNDSVIFRVSVDGPPLGLKILSISVEVDGFAE